MTLEPRLSATLAALLAAASACSGDAPVARAAGPAAPTLPAAHAASALPRLLFFMNPNGAPCQTQDRVLRDMGSELSGRAEVVYVRTTEPADLAEFRRYGIRALPTLVLADSTGREIRRATPGIQPPEQIRRLVGP